MTELKPCPFCWSKDVTLYEHEDFGGAFYVMCECCGANLGTTLDNIALDEEEIANLWNTRVCAVSKKEPKTNDVDRFNALDVLKVMKMVKKPHTNEEYIKSCTTKQLADVLFKIWENGYNSTTDIHKPFSFLFGEEWLKEERK